MKLLIKCLFFFYPFFLYANETGYEVEVIVFEELAHKYSDSEIWFASEDIQSADSQIKNFNDIRHNNQSEHVDPIFKKLSTENSRLHNELNKLKNSNDYNILAHEIWKQTGLDAEKSFSVHLNSRTKHIESVNATASPLSEQTISDKNNSFLTGSVTLIMSRYLHVNADLVFHMPEKFNLDETSIKTNLNKNYKSYPVVFERRMRSKEVHYIDHPLIGMIILAIPFQIESEHIEEDSPSNQNQPPPKSNI